jgi:hypothetical protein
MQIKVVRCNFLFLPQNILFSMIAQFLANSRYIQINNYQNATIGNYGLTKHLK